MDIEFGNTNKLNTDETDWFIGFSDWTKNPEKSGCKLRNLPKGANLSDLCVKWMFHPQGDSIGFDKTISVGRAISVLISERGAFDLDFSTDSHFPDSDTESYSLSKQGNFVIWGSGLFHRSTVALNSTILTIRWQD